MTNSPRPHRFDDLAQGHAAGLSRRQVLTRLLAGAAAASPLGALARDPERAWAAARRSRSSGCEACRLSTAGVTCTPCSGSVSHGHAAKRMRALARHDRSYRRLKAYAFAHHYRIAAPKLISVTRPNGPSYLALEASVSGPGGARGSILLLAVGAEGLHHPLAALVHTTGDPNTPTVAVTSRVHGGGVDITDPWNPAAVRRAAIELSLARPGGTEAQATPAARPGPTVHVADAADCESICEAICASLDKACSAGLAAAMSGCLKSGNPVAAAICAASIFAACKLIQPDPDTCKKTICGPICGCPTGSLPCPTGPLGALLTCTPITSNPNCGDCGVTCAEPLVCVGDPLDWSSYHCGCPPAKCPSGAPPDPANGCQCTECTAEGGCSGRDQCCGSHCVDTMTDNNNCGNCGIVCQSGSTCVQGQCCGEVCAAGVCCPPGTHCCVDVPGQLWNCCGDEYGCCGAYHTCNTHC